MGKTLWLAMRRQARMLGSGSGPTSSPRHHWDRGAKTRVTRHSGKPSKGVGGGQHMAVMIKAMGWSAWFDVDQHELSQTNRRAGEPRRVHKGESAWGVAQTFGQASHRLGRALVRPRGSS